MPEGDTLVRTADGLRPYLLGRTVTAASARPPGPRVERLVGTTVTAVEAQGKNLLIRFDNGLEVRTHLRMHGSWHRYRPGEPWRRAPARARLVIEVPGSVAVCFDAPVVELFEQRAEGLHPALGRLGPDLLKDPFDVAEALRRLRDPSRADGRSPRRSWTSARSPASATRSRTRSCGRRGCRRGRQSATWTTRLRALVSLARDVLREGAATGRRPRHVYRRAGRPCPRCGAIIRVEHQGRDLPRLTFWCPTCQPDPRSRA